MPVYSHVPAIWPERTNSPPPHGKSGCHQGEVTAHTASWSALRSAWAAVPSSSCSWKGLRADAAGLGVRRQALASQRPAAKARATSEPQAGEPGGDGWRGPVGQSKAISAAGRNRACRIRPLFDRGNATEQKNAQARQHRSRAAIVARDRVSTMAPGTHPAISTGRASGRVGAPVNSTARGAGGRLSQGQCRPPCQPCRHQGEAGDDPPQPGASRA